MPVGHLLSQAPLPGGSIIKFAREGGTVLKEWYSESHPGTATVTVMSLRAWRGSACTTVPQTVPIQTMHTVVPDIIIGTQGWEPRTKDQRPCIATYKLNLKDWQVASCEDFALMQSSLGRMTCNIQHSRASFLL